MIGSHPEPCPSCGTVRATRAEPLDLCPACLLATALTMEEEPCPYQVLTPIGDDPESVTYLAQSLMPRRGYVALKILSPRHDVDQILMRFDRWKGALARVRHPGIAALIDVGLTEDGQVYVATDYVAGWSLAAAGSRPPLRIDECAEIARQLTAAIAAAHAAGVPHLTLNASKVKISTAAGIRATILSFGSSLIVDGLEPRFDADLAALAGLIRGLGVQP